jgi:uncharacterized small protein (DUF1192 family)
VTTPQPDESARDVAQRRLIENSRRLRDQLAVAVEELDHYVQALQAEIERKRDRLRQLGDAK